MQSVNVCIILRTLVYDNPPRGTRQAKDLVDEAEAVSIAQHALRCSVHSTLGSSPGSLVFNRDMFFLNVPLVADWNLLTKCRQHAVNENLRHSNLKRRSLDYMPNQKVSKKLHKVTRMSEKYSGLYTITQVHVNGTITIQLGPNVTKRINIRQVIPHHGDPT